MVGLLWQQSSGFRAWPCTEPWVLGAGVSGEVCGISSLVLSFIAIAVWSFPRPGIDHVPACRYFLTYWAWGFLSWLTARTSKNVEWLDLNGVFPPIVWNLQAICGRNSSFCGSRKPLLYHYFPQWSGIRLFSILWFCYLPCGFWGFRTYLAQAGTMLEAGGDVHGSIVWVRLEKGTHHFQSHPIGRDSHIVRAKSEGYGNSIQPCPGKGMDCLEWVFLSLSPSIIGKVYVGYWHWWVLDWGWHEGTLYQT